MGIVLNLPGHEVQAVTHSYTLIFLAQKKYRQISTAPTGTMTWQHTACTHRVLLSTLNEFRNPVDTLLQPGKLQVVLKASEGSLILKPGRHV